MLECWGNERKGVKDHDQSLSASAAADALRFFCWTRTMNRAADTRWFRKVSGEFCPVLRELAGRPITYVEVGCWEGASAQWVAQNVLTHPMSRGFGIDPYSAMLPRHSQQSMDERFDIASERLAGYPNWQWIRKPSVEALRSWACHIDCLYVDGVHEAPHPLIDFVFAWPHLGVGSLVIFDDYAIGMRKRFPCVPEAVRAVEIAFAGMVERVGNHGRQAALRVTRKANDAGWFTDARIERAEAAVA